MFVVSTDLFSDMPNMIYSNCEAESFTYPGRLFRLLHIPVTLFRYRLDILLGRASKNLCSVTTTQCISDARHKIAKKLEMWRAVVFWVISFIYTMCTRANFTPMGLLYHHEQTSHLPLRNAPPGSHCCLLCLNLRHEKLGRCI